VSEVVRRNNVASPTTTVKLKKIKKQTEALHPPHHFNPSCNVNEMVCKNMYCKSNQQAQVDKMQ